jgi:hypothetical protein
MAPDEDMKKATLRLTALRFIAALTLVPDWAWMLLALGAAGVFLLDWKP